MGRISLLACLSALMLCLVACGGGAHAPSSPTVVPSPTQVAASLTPGVQGARPTATPYINVPALIAVRFTDQQTGWASGAIGIIATKDGGRTWRAQQVPPDKYLSLDSVSAQVGWAVGIHTLIGTDDGGTTWTVLNEPSVPLVDVDFVNPSVGWGISKGDPISLTGGRLVKSIDGGRSWSNEAASAPVRSVCASSADDVWAAGAKAVLHTADGGATWFTSFTLPLAGDLWSGELWCATPDVAWVQFSDGVATGHMGHVIYRTLDGGHHWDVMMAERFTVGDAVKAPDTPGPYPGPLSVVDARTAIVVGYCWPCGEGGTSSIRSTTDGGATWSSDVIVAAPSEGSRDVDFVDRTYGWAVMSFTTGDEILATTDGGRTWTKQYP